MESKGPTHHDPGVGPEAEGYPFELLVGGEGVRLAKFLFIEGVLLSPQWYAGCKFFGFRH